MDASACGSADGLLYRANTARSQLVKVNWYLSAPHLARRSEPAVRRNDSSTTMAREDCDLGVRAM